MADGNRFPATHRQMYPEQYEHELCGQFVRVIGRQSGDEVALGKVERVVNSRFGPLAILKGSNTQAWSVADCHPNMEVITP